MNKWAITLATAGLLALAGAAQHANRLFKQAAGQGDVASTGLAGAAMQAELAKSIDAKKARPGEEISAKLSQDVISGGEVVLPKGTRLIGHVLEVQAHSKEHPESRLVLVFDKAVPKRGQEMAISAVIVAIAPPLQESVPARAGDNLGVPESMGSRGNQAGGTLGGGTKASRSPAGDSAIASVTQADGATGNNSGAGAPGPQPLTAASRGVIGLEGLALYFGNEHTALVSSSTKNVKLESGTQLLLLLQASKQQQ